MAPEARTCHLDTCSADDVPAGWIVGDKTGGGDYGANNDVAVLWPPGKPPIVLALYMTQREKEAKPMNEVLAEATRVVAGILGQQTTANGSLLTEVINPANQSRELA